MIKFLGALDSRYWIKDSKELSRNFPQGNRVYDSSGIAVTLSSQGGGIGGVSGLYLIQIRADKDD